PAAAASAPCAAEGCPWATCRERPPRDPAARWRSPPRRSRAAVRKAVPRRAAGSRRRSGEAEADSWCGDATRTLRKPVRELDQGNAGGADILGLFQLRGAKARKRSARVGKVHRGPRPLPGQKRGAVVDTSIHAGEIPVESIAEPAGDAAPRGRQHGAVLRRGGDESLRAVVLVEALDAALPTQ